MKLLCFFFVVVVAVAVAPQTSGCFNFFVSFAFAVAAAVCPWLPLLLPACPPASSLLSHSSVVLLVGFFNF